MSLFRWVAEAQLADAYAAHGDLANADREFRRSIATVETARSSVKTEEFRLSFLSSAIAVYGDYIDFLAGEGKMDEGLQVAELLRPHACRWIGVQFGCAVSSDSRVSTDSNRENTEQHDSFRPARGETFLRLGD